MSKLIILENHLNRTQRISVVCFLVGNGILDENLIMCLIRNKLKDKSAFNHMRATIKDVMSNKYDDIWTYFNVSERCILYLNGNVAFEEQRKLSTTDLKICMWSRYSSKQKTSYREEQLFWGEDEKICEKVYSFHLWNPKKTIT